MGREFALQIAEKFRVDEVWLVARRKDRLEELAAVMEARRAERAAAGESYPRARVFGEDISGREGVARFSDILERERAAASGSGGLVISVLVNNAGFGTYGEFAATDIRREMDMIELNCTALTGICGLALPLMERGSVLINTASLAAFLPLGNFAVYGATKAYVLSFTEALAAEVADRGIRVCALCPGPVSTEFAAVASNGARENVLRGLPADKVVRHCLSRAARGRRMAVMAFAWKFKAAASRFVGRYAGARFTYKYCKRPCR